MYELAIMAAWQPGKHILTCCGPCPMAGCPSVWTHPADKICANYLKISLSHSVICVHARRHCCPYKAYCTRVYGLV